MQRRRWVAARNLAHADRKPDRSEDRNADGITEPDGDGDTDRLALTHGNSNGRSDDDTYSDR